MDNFDHFAELVAKNFKNMSKNELFVTIDDRDSVWDAYLASFPEGTNPIFRERTEHDCSCCKQFLRNIGNVVVIEGNTIKTVWDVIGAPAPYDVVAAELDRLVKSQPITGLFRSKEPSFGNKQTLERAPDKTVIRWNHFHGNLVARHQSQSPESDRGSYASSVSVFRRGLDEITDNAVDTVMELIGNGNLYRGEEHLEQVKSFRKLKTGYAKLGTDLDRNIFSWANAGAKGSRLRNTAIGTLLQDLSEEKDLEHSVNAFERIMAPTNYKRPKALITKGMVDDAMKTIRGLGLEDSLVRRFARISDVSINNVLWVDNSVQDQMRDGIEGLLMESVSPVKPTGKAEDIGIEDFMAKVVPTSIAMDVFVRNNLQPNFMSLTAPASDCGGQIFKWSNGFGWSYDGNITDSIKEKVKRAGGNTNAPVRFSLAWFNRDDLDIHVYEPNGNHIFFGNKAGMLDVDMNANGPKSDDPVENVSFMDPKDGVYSIRVNNYTKRTNSNPGFVIEVESHGKILQFSYTSGVDNGKTVDIGSVTVKNGSVTKIDFIKEMIGGGISSEKWGLNTEQFVKVNTLMLSPNHWDDNAVGNKHWFFALDGCNNDAPARGIYNEFLAAGLDKHRKVFEVLGEKTKCSPTNEQLSGIGFSSTRDDSALIRVSGKNYRKDYNVTF
jgi:hypothetical protein